MSALRNVSLTKLTDIGGKNRSYIRRGRRFADARVEALRKKGNGGLIEPVGDLCRRPSAPRIRHVWLIVFLRARESYYPNAKSKRGNRRCAGRKKRLVPSSGGRTCAYIVYKQINNISCWTKLNRRYLICCTPHLPRETIDGSNKLKVLLPNFNMKN